MFLPQRRITFTSATTGRVIVYDYVCGIEIHKSYQTLTDTAIITIPRKLVFKSGDPLSPKNYNNQVDYIDQPAIGATQNQNYVVGADALFTRGDQVKIEVGYCPNLTKRFEGFISKVYSKLPVEIHCEDKMWLLKQSNVIYPAPSKWVKTQKKKSKGYKISVAASTLKQVLDGILAYVNHRIDYKTVDDNISLGKIRIDNVNAAKVLEVLKDRYGLYSYFRDDGILYVGFGNNAANTNTQEFVMEEVVINNDTLTWTNADDVPIMVKGVSMNADDTKFEYEAGDPGGDTITKFTYNQSQSGLKKFVDNLLPTLKYDGYRGTVVTLLEPEMNHGDIAKLTSKRLPERNGNYLIKSVKIVDGSGGAFQELELGVAMNESGAYKNPPPAGKFITSANSQDKITIGG